MVSAVSRSRHTSARPDAAQASSVAALASERHGDAGNIKVGFEPLLPPRFVRFPTWLAPTHDRMAPWLFWILVGVVFAVGVVLRFWWHMRVGVDVPDLQAHGAPLMTTGDGYFFALGSDIALSGDDYGLTRYPAASNTALAALGWLVTKLSPASLDAVAYYLPPFFGALIVVPTALIARDVAGPRAGILAGLMVLVAPRYAGRTVAGYFDTDMFAVTPLLFAIWFFIRLSREGRARDGLYAALVLGAMPFMYSQGGPVAAAVAAACAVVLVLYHRKDEHFAASLAVLGISQLPLDWGVRVLIMVPVWFVLRRAPLPAVPLRWAGIAVGLVGFALSAEWAGALQKIGIFTGAGGGGVVAGGADPDAVVLGDTTRFVSEAKQSGIDLLGVSVSGALPIFVIAMFGWIVLQFRHRSLMVLAPFVGLGFFALIGGVRFGIYGAAPAAIGLAGLAVLLSTIVRQPVVRALVFVALAGAAVVPGALLVAGNPAVPQTLAGEVEALDALGKVIKPGDVTIAWWDYGYPIAYYAHSGTLVDGGQRAEDAAIAAEVLLSNSQRGAAILARLAAETQLRVGPGNVARALFKDAKEKFGLGQIDFVRALTYPMYPLPPKTHEVYLYLPTRMVGILGPIGLSRPFEVGTKPTPLRAGVAPNARVRIENNTIDVGNGVLIDAVAVVVRTPRGVYPLKTLYVTRGSGTGAKVQARSNPKAPANARSGIYVEDQGIFYELDDALVSSVYVQLGLLYNADPNVFELVFANPLASIYRLKI